MQNRARNKKALTLIELFMVVVITGIIAVFAMPAYMRAKQRAADEEAQSQLPLLQAAERIVWEEQGSFINCAGNCNSLLRINVPESTTWTYSVTVNGAGTGFCAQAVGTAGTGNWFQDHDDQAADQNGCYN